VRERTAEHVYEWFKRRSWTTLFVVPLDPSTPSQQVNKIERRIGRQLKPTDTRRLLAPFGLL
jgi:hypothetical protein